MALTLPTSVNDRILQSGYAREESSRFSTSQPASGTYYVQLETDDAVFQFSLQVTLTQEEAATFRNWLKGDGSESALWGDRFSIKLWSENGFSYFDAAFPPDGLPQIASVNALDFTYNMSVTVRAQNGAPAVLLPASGVLIS